jgi:hypothetical protein
MMTFKGSSATVVRSVRLKLQPLVVNHDPVEIKKDGSNHETVD